MQILAISFSHGSGEIHSFPLWNYYYTASTPRSFLKNSLGAEKQKEIARDKIDFPFR